MRTQPLCVALLVFAPTAARLAAGPVARGGVVSYAPHLRIDWSDPHVEVDGRVVLREGMLELFACTPGTREHESIVAVDARPLRIFEALGLIGLTPGRPVRYDAETDKLLPATGDTVRIDVRWEQRGQRRTVDVGKWMQDTATGRPVPPVVWRFAGSTRNQEGAFLADADGTVVCVVDFTSALVALGEMKSADNSALWVQANTDQIPPIDTPVTLLFSPVKPVAFDLRIGPNGELTCDRKPVSMKRIVDRIRRFQKDHPLTRVGIHVHPAAPRHLVERVEEAVRHTVNPGTPVEIVTETDKRQVDRTPPSGNSADP